MVYYTIGGKAMTKRPVPTSGFACEEIKIGCGDMVLIIVGAIILSFYIVALILFLALSC